jgi:hypothetical protein
MRIMIKLLNVVLLCAALWPAAACEDDPHDLDYLKDSAADEEHGDHDHDQAPNEDDAG